MPQITDLASDQQSAAPQLTLQINRDTASRLGIDAVTIDSVLYDAFGQRHYTSLNQYFVIMEAKPGFQLRPSALQRIYVKSQTAGMVPLSELVTQHTTLAPLSVNHQGQFPSVTLRFNLKDNAPLGPAVAAINQAMQSLHVPPTIQASFQGNAQAFQASLSSTPILIVAALIAVYIILGMLYREHHPSVDHHFDPAFGRRRWFTSTWSAYPGWAAEPAVGSRHTLPSQRNSAGRPGVAAPESCRGRPAHRGE